MTGRLCLAFQMDQPYCFEIERNTMQITREELPSCLSYVNNIPLSELGTPETRSLVNTCIIQLTGFASFEQIDMHILKSSLTSSLLGAGIPSPTHPD
jgi:hypothetical protein